MLNRSHQHRFALSGFTRVKPGFTLVELMISIALVLLLVAGINQVFSLTSKTIGTGQASSNAQRDMRAAKRVMEDDFAGALTTDVPCFIINNQRVYAFRNKQDQLTDHDYPSATTAFQQQVAIGTADVQNTGDEIPIPPAFYNNRNHRVDQIRFFAHGTFHRQTGDPGNSTPPTPYSAIPPSLISSTTSSDAWITYGHAQLPNNTAVANPPYYDPGQADVSTSNRNDNNRYASQWMLIREAILLVPSVNQEAALRRRVFTGIVPTPPPELSPLSALSPALTMIKPPPAPPNNYTNQGRNIADSSFDLAEASLTSFGADLAARIRAGTNTAILTPMANLTTPVWYRVLSPTELSNYASTPYQGTGNLTNLEFRFKCNPFITRPLTRDVAAKASPQFVTSCSQFIVEFAGDFVTQNAAGDVTDDKPDGIIDFVIPDPGFPNAGARQIRWYGLPRDTDGDGIINGQYYDVSILPKRPNNDMPDVVPVRDVIQSCGLIGVPGSYTLTATDIAAQTRIQALHNATDNYASAPFECEVNNIQPTTAFPTAPAIYGVPAQSDYAASMNINSNYLCIWTGGGPSMVRIIMNVDDPNGRLPEGAVFEYVFSLKK